MLSLIGRGVSRQPFPVAILVGSLVAFYLLTSPLLIYVPSPGLDPSWQVSLGAAFAQHLQFGTQFVWTYGPLGFLQLPWLYPETALWAASALFALATHALLALTVSRLLWVRHSDRQDAMLSVSVAALVIFVASGGLGTEYSLLISALCLQWTELSNRTRSPALYFVASVVVLAVASLIKSSDLLVSVPQLLLYALLPSRKNGPKRLTVLVSGATLFTIVMIGLWLVAGQSLPSLVPFLRGTAGLVEGYSSAMALPGMVVQTLAALFILIDVTGASLIGQSPTLWVAAPLAFEAWKEGFVRHDPTVVGGHALIFFSVMALLTFIAFSNPGAPRLSRRLMGFGLSTALIFAIISGYQSLVVSVPAQLSTFREAVTLAISPAERAATLAQERATVRQAYGLTSTILSKLRAGTVNVLPTDSIIPVIEGLHWNPSPIPQTYSAYTPYLDHVNATQMASRDGAQILLWTSLQSVDGRYAFFDEPRTFVAMLEHYRTTYQASNGDVLLARRTTHTPRLWRESGLGFARFGQIITIPATPALELKLIKVDIRPSLAGRLTSLVLRQGAVYVAMRVARHWVGPFRFVTGVGKDGLFVTEYIPDASAFGALFQGTIQNGLVITGLRFTTSAPMEYRPEFSVALYESRRPYFRRLQLQP